MFEFYEIIDADTTSDEESETTRLSYDPYHHTNVSTASLYRR